MYGKVENKCCRYILRCTHEPLFVSELVKYDLGISISLISMNKT